MAHWKAERDMETGLPPAGAEIRFIVTPGRPAFGHEDGALFHVLAGEDKGSWYYVRANPLVARLVSDNLPVPRALRPWIDDEAKNVTLGERLVKAPPRHRFKKNTK